MSLDLELYSLAVMVLAGVLLGFLFDLVRLCRWASRGRGPLPVLVDLWFWASALLVIVGALMLANWGAVRAYVFLGLAGGFWMYLALGSRLVVDVGSSCLSGMARTWRRTRAQVRRGAAALAGGGRRAATGVDRGVRATSRWWGKRLERWGRSGPWAPWLQCRRERREARRDAWRAAGQAGPEGGGAEQGASGAGQGGISPAGGEGT